MSSPREIKSDIKNPATLPHLLHLLSPTGRSLPTLPEEAPSIPPHSSSNKYHSLHTGSEPRTRLVAAGLSQHAQRHCESDLTVHSSIYRPSFVESRSAHSKGSQRDWQCCQWGCGFRACGQKGRCWVRAWLRLWLNISPIIGERTKEPQSHAGLVECVEQREPGKPRQWQEPRSLLFSRLRP